MPRRLPQVPSSRHPGAASRSSSTIVPKSRSRTLRTWPSRSCPIRSRIRRASRRATTNGRCSLQSVPIWGASRLPTRALMTATSVLAMARFTTPQAVSGKDPRRSISHCRPTNSSPIARYGSVDCFFQFVLQGFQDERTVELPAEEPNPAVARAAAAHRWAHLLLLRRLPDSAQSQLLVDLRRHSHLHAGGADRDRHCARNALHAARRLCLQLRRAHHARRELRLAVALRPRQRRLHVLSGRLYPHVPRLVLRLI